MRKKIHIKNIFLIILSGLILIAFAFSKNIKSVLFGPRTSTVKTGLILNNSDAGKKSDLKESENISVVTEDLVVPWDIAFLPDGELLVTERGGNLLKIGNKKETVAKIDGVAGNGEGGLLGIVLHPDFKTNKFVYLYMTVRTNGKLQNRIERYVFDNNQLKERTLILEGIEGAANHDGGRMDFGPDGFLYVTTGDAQTGSLAGDINNLNGKVLRITGDGKPAPGNPFGNEVFSFGHRNPQGLAWDDEGNLWSTEHGPSGLQSGNDEVNLIVSGGNYGWPDFVGSESGDGIIKPVLESGRSDTWAPASLIFYNKSLFFGGLRGEALYQAKINEDKTLKLTQHFKSEFGRLRTVRTGPDGYVYITTSNRDGRGNAKPGDDKILKINPEIFFE